MSIKYKDPETGEWVRGSARGPQGEKGDPGVYVLAEGETLENVPEDVTVVVDPYGVADCTVEDIVAATLEVINNDTY